MRAKDHRKAIPVGVKLKSALLLAGFTEAEIDGGLIEFDHTPALALRTIDESGEIQPPANDYRYIRPMLAEAHAAKTRGTGATTAGSDVGNAAKVKRIEKDPGGGEEFRRRLLAKKTLTGCTTPEQAESLSRWHRGGKPPETKKRKRPWPTRKFETRKKP